MRTADVAVSAQDFRIPLPLMVAAFCLLWSSAFAVAKIGIADCPPLLLLTFRFLLAGVLMLGAAGGHRRLAEARPPRPPAVRDARHRQPGRLSRHRLCRAAHHLVGPVGARHQRQPGADGGAGRGLPQRAHDLAQGPRPCARRRRRGVHRREPRRGRRRAPRRHRLHARGASVAGHGHHPVQAVRAVRRALGR